MTKTASVTMKTLISKLMIKAGLGIVGVATFTLGLFFLVSHLTQTISESFYLSASLLAATPGLTFLTAFWYHYWVVGPIKRICALDDRSLNDLQKVVIESARDIIGFSRIIPIVFSALALVMAVIVIPGILISVGFSAANIVQTIFVSAIISGQLILAIRVIRQIVHAVRYLKELS